MRMRLLMSVGIVALTLGLGDLKAGEPVPPVGSVKACPDSPVTPVPPSRGAFIEGPAIPPEDWLCHANPEVCGPIADFWFGAEFLAWCMRKSDLPPLVTTSPAASGGVLGQPGTVVLVGGDSLAPEDGFLGGRFTAGAWLDYEQHYGLEGSYFFLAERSNEFAATSPGGGVDPILARPFVDSGSGAESARTIPFAGFTNGAIFVRSASGLQGADLNFICNRRCGDDCAYRLDLLLGIRFLQLTDDLLIREAAVDGAGTNFFVEDAFAARSMFLGPQVGVSGEYRYGRWVGTGRFKLALGVSHYDVDITGFTKSVATDGTTTVFTGGLLALSSNIGKHDDDTFAVVPEVALQLGYRVCEYATLTAGYNFIYWSDVVRAGDHVDRAINPALVPVGLPPSFDPTQRPVYRTSETSFWAQGVSVGLEVRY